MRTVANSDDSTRTNTTPIGREVQFIATTDTNKESEFKFARDLKINEVCKVIYGTNNFNQDGSTPIDVTVYPPQGLASLIPQDDPWAFSPDFDSPAHSQLKYQAKPLKSGKANVGKTDDGMIVEWGGILPSLYLRKTMAVNVAGHFISGITYEIRRGTDGQTFDEMDYQGRVSCILSGY